MHRLLVFLQTAVNLIITAVLYTSVVGGFINRGIIYIGSMRFHKPRWTWLWPRYHIHRLLVVLQTAVNLCVTAVLYTSVRWGFINRGELDYNRRIIYIGCWWFYKPRYQIHRLDEVQTIQQNATDLNNISINYYSESKILTLFSEFWTWAPIRKFSIKITVERSFSLLLYSL